MNVDVETAVKPKPEGKKKGSQNKIRPGLDCG
jgi:hypothetical protein